MMRFLKNPLFIIAIAIIAGLSIAGYAYFGLSNNRWLSAASMAGETGVQKMALVEEVSATGKVKPAKKVNLVFERGGKVVSVPVNVGDYVSAGQTLVVLDRTELSADLKQAEASLENAKFGLEKLKEPVDSLALLQAENALVQAQEAKRKAEDNLKKAYEDGFNVAADAFLDLPSIINGLKGMLFSNDFSPNQWNIDFWYDNSRNIYDSLDKALSYREDAYNSYQTARAQYDKNFNDYKAASRYSDNAVLEALLNETYETTKAIANAVKSTNNLLDYFEDKITDKGQKQIPLWVGPKEAVYQADLDAYTAKTNAHLLNLLAIKNTIKNARDALADAERAISERKEAIKKLKEGADAFDIASQENRIESAQALVDKIKMQIAKTVLRAPFSGIVSDININVGEFAAPNVPVVSLISNAKYEIEAIVSEIDIAKVKIGDSARITLDAYGGNEVFEAKVSSIDPTETTINGVAAYKITLQFVKNDEHIKSGMTANVKILVGKRVNVIAVPEQAIITKGADKFVLVDNGKSSPEKRKVKIGIKGSNGFVEILSGLKEGERVINFGNRR